MKEAIIFDLDGTLWDATNEIEFIWKIIAKSYNFEINKDKIETII